MTKKFMGKPFGRLNESTNKSVWKTHFTWPYFFWRVWEWAGMEADFVSLRVLDVASNKSAVVYWKDIGMFT